MRSGRTPLPRHRRLRRHRAARGRARHPGRPRHGAAGRARPGQDPADPLAGRPARRVDAGHPRLRAQRAPAAPDHAGVAPAGRPRPGDDQPVGWLHRSLRYGEKLATPDTSVADLVGDVDPIKVAQGRTLGDPETIHFGLVPRTNRGIFAVNELPDLAERIQVSLLNVLEERDIQVRGYQLRLPLDLLLVASANPEDYTNRGRIITPLKDRFGAEIRTHYPLDLDLEIALVRQEAALVAERARTPARGAGPVRPRGARVAVGRRPLRRLGPVRDRGRRDRRRVGAAPLRPARRGRGGGPDRRHRVGDQHAARQGRVRERRGGPRGRDPRAPAAHRDGRDVPGPAGRPRPVRLHQPGRRGRHRRDRRAGLGRRGAAPGRHRARAWPRCWSGSTWATRRPGARRRPASSSCWRGCT